MVEALYDITRRKRLPLCCLPIVRELPQFLSPISLFVSLGNIREAERERKRRVIEATLIG